MTDLFRPGTEWLLEATLQRITSAGPINHPPKRVQLINIRAPARCATVSDAKARRVELKTFLAGEPEADSRLTDGPVSPACGHLAVPIPLM